MKRKAYNLSYKKYVCQLVTNQAFELYGLFCSKDRYNSYKLKEIECYQKLLNKLWVKLREEEDLLIQEMIDLDFNNLDIQSVLLYAEPIYPDDYEIMEAYGIVLGNFECTERRINSLRY
jgi:hypothetical protein